MITGTLGLAGRGGTLETERRTESTDCCSFGASINAGRPDRLMPAARCTSHVTKLFPSSDSKFHLGGPWHGGIVTSMNLHIFIVGAELFNEFVMMCLPKNFYKTKLSMGHRVELMHLSFLPCRI